LNCHSCGKSTKEIYSEVGDSREWCFQCYSAFTNRRFWAQQKEKENEEFSKPSGICYYCKIHSKTGVFKEIRRDGKEKCKTWVCWRCNNQRPDLSKFGMKW